jgi:type I restriction enzyme, S subunit
VAQDVADEPASELLKRIAKEKARLLSEGEIRRDKVPSSINADDEPFSLPHSWRWCRLRSLASALGDGLHGTPNYVTGTDCYFINGNNLENGLIVIKPTTKTVSAEEVRKHKKPLNQHSVLVSINGTLGKVAFYDGQDIVLGKSACYFNLTEFTSKWFAKLVLDSPYFTNYAVESATGATIMNLSLNAMNEFPFPLPPLAEQHRIVAKVDALMTLCDRLEASLTATTATRRRLLDALLAEALAPADDREMEAAE